MHKENIHHVGLFGINHRTAPIKLLEIASFPKESFERALMALKSYQSISGAVILSTCNRVEIYFTTHNFEEAVLSIKEFISSFHRIEEGVLSPHIYIYRGRDAIRHLLTVSAGLDSMIVGEPQILGQVKKAFEGAMRVGASDKVLNQIMKFALKTGKRVRTETGLGEGAVSVSYAAITHIKRKIKTLKGRKVLIIGTGEMGSLCTRYLESMGVDTFIFASRSIERAEVMAQRFGGKEIPLERIYEVISEVDIVISATSSPHLILRGEEVMKRMESRVNRPLFIFDMAIPRDVDPALKGVAGINLYDLDDLKGVSETNMEKRREAIPRAKEIIQEETEKVFKWLKNEEALPYIVRAREEFERMILEESERIRRSFPESSERDMEKMLRSIERERKRHLHEIISRIKSGERSLNLEAFLRKTTPSIN